MKTAKLEIKVIVALFVAGYDFDIVDSTGNFPKSLPRPNHNDIHQVSTLSYPLVPRLTLVVAAPTDRRAMLPEVQARRGVRNCMLLSLTYTLCCISISDTSFQIPSHNNIPMGQLESCDLVKHLATSTSVLLVSQSILCGHSFSAPDIQHSINSPLSAM